jgi:hypothetical protein
VTSMKYALCSCLALFAMLFVNVVVSADQRREIPIGASMGDVLELWGAPDEKVVKEVKKEVVWYYPDKGSVVFRDGNVLKWSYPLKYREVLGDQNKSSTASPEIDKEAENLVRDMAEAVRGAGSMSDSNVPSSGVVDQKPPLVRSRNSRNPRGIPIGDDEEGIEDDEEDLLEE